jgi:hypothetical protein
MDVMGTTAGPADSFSTADRQVIASFASYAAAERAVDHLADAVPVPGSGCSSVCSSVCSRGGRCGSD